MGESAGTPSADDSVRSGSIVVQYRTPYDTSEEPTSANSDEVLAYPKNVPQNGGQVLMHDRRIKTMTADEFRAASLAGSS